MNAYLDYFDGTEDEDKTCEIYDVVPFDKLKCHICKEWGYFYYIHGSKWNVVMKSRYPPQI
jgi:hypothetical protein